MERGGIVVVRDGEQAVVSDARPWPIVFATWFGAPTEALVDAYFDGYERLLDDARRRRERMIMITDTFATQRPDPKARKRIGDRSAAQPADVAGLMLKSYIVIESPLIRGVVTALRWFLPTLEDVDNVDSIETAIERALSQLDAARIPRPSNLDPRTYRRPARP